MNRFSLTSAIPTSSSPLGSTSRFQKATSLAHPSLASTASFNHLDGLARYVDAHLSDYLTNEIAACISESATHSLRRTMEIRKAYEEEQRGKSRAAVIGAQPIKPEATDGPQNSLLQPPQSEVVEGCRVRMDVAGYRVGWVLAERLARHRDRFPRAHQPYSPSPSPDQLEVIKFICKDL